MSNQSIVIPNGSSTLYPNVKRGQFLSEFGFLLFLFFKASVSWEKVDTSDFCVRDHTGFKPFMGYDCGTTTYF
jgi:hypothetical protein